MAKNLYQRGYRAYIRLNNNGIALQTPFQWFKKKPSGNWADITSSVVKCCYHELT